MASTEKSITVEIHNWKKFNPRPDVERSSWFRMEHSMLEGDEFYDFSHSELIAWIYILSQASKKNCATVFISFDRAERVLRIKASCLQSALLKLEKLQMVTVHVTSPLRERNVGDTSTVATNERTNERDRVGLDPNSIYQLWNSSTKLRKAEKLSDKRVKQAKVQIQKYPDLEHWKRVLEKFERSEFCVNEWKPTLDDFLSEEKRLRALEGKYDRKLGQRPSPPPINTTPIRLGDL